MTTPNQTISTNGSGPNNAMDLEDKIVVCGAAICILLVLLGVI
jgi:hypothetical protein